MTDKHWRRYLRISLLGVAILAILAACTTPPPPAAVTSVTVQPKALSLEVGQTRTLTAEVEVTGGASTDVVWGSSNSSVATVSNAGLVTAVGAGTATITVRSAADSTKSDTAIVTVTEPEEEGDPDEVVSVTIDQADFDLSVGSSRTLTATVVVTGEASDAVAWSTSDAAVATVNSASGVVAAVAPGTAVISATSTEDSTKSDSVTVSVTTLPVASISSFEGTLARGSVIEFSWTGADADEYELFAVGADDVSLAVLDGAETSYTAPVPASTHQAFRLEARAAGGSDTATLAPLGNIVLNSLDYDPYTGQGRPADEPILGSLRSVIDDAAAGSIIGFAADVGPVLTITGVQLVGGEGDAHLFLDKDVIISGPAAGITIRGASGYTGADPDEAITWQSRVVLVTAGSEVILENLTLTGGDFIFLGGGVRNNGTLTLVNTEVSGNRAWNVGGGIYNTGSLTLIDSAVSNNTAYTTDDEIGTQYNIRGSAVTIPDVPFAAEGYGGGIYNTGGGTIDIQNSVVSDNASRFTAGGIAVTAGSTLTADGLSVTGNSVNHTEFDPVPGDFSYGGGILNAGTLSMVDSTFTGNLAWDQGGGIYHTELANTDLGGVAFTNNSADFGGAIQQIRCETAGSTFSQVGLTFSGNTSRSGGDDNNLVLLDEADCTLVGGSIGGIPLLPSFESLRELQWR